MADDVTIRGRRGFSLRLTDDGFEMRFLWRSSRFRWSDISGEFRRSQRYVVFDLTPSARTASRLRRAYALMQRTLVGFDAGIGAAYGVSQEELVRLLDERLSLARGAGSRPGQADDCPAPSERLDRLSAERRRSGGGC